MGIFDHVAGLLSGAGKATLTVQLEPGETEVTRAVASNRPGTVTSVGGDLVLTNRRLVFTPLNVKDLTAALTWGLGKVGAPEPAAKLVDQVGKLVDTHEFGTVSSLAGVSAGSPPSLRKPPTLVVVSGAGTWEIGILAGRTKMSRDPSNAMERDRMLAAIRAQIA